MIKPHCKPGTHFGNGSTKILLACAALLALGASAAAKLAPVEPPRADAVILEDALYLGPIGALVESDYFNVRQSPAGGSRVFPCRPRLHGQPRTAAFAQVCD